MTVVTISGQIDTGTSTLVQLVDTAAASALSGLLMAATLPSDHILDVSIQRTADATE